MRKMKFKLEKTPLDFKPYDTYFKNSIYFNE